MNCQKEETAARIKLSALITHIMSSESSRRDTAGAFHPPNFGNPNMEGTNAGATMIVHRGSGESSGEVNDSCGINIYINNNIQGLNNSIMIGSRLHMPDPGVWLTLKESKLERWFAKKSSSDVHSSSLGFYVLLVSAIVGAFAVMFFM